MIKGNFRWLILVLLFIATTILYADRAALGILAPELQEEIGWTEQQYGLINTAFMIAYAVCFLIMGSIIDRIGTRRGYLLSIIIWSLAAAGHALARSWVGFALARFSLAIGQSGNFPSAIKAVAEWFPKKERALAVGIFNGGANMGTILAPLIIPPIVLAFDDWRTGFVWTLPLSLAWILVWMKQMKQPHEHARVSPAELSLINSDSGNPETADGAGNQAPEKGAGNSAIRPQNEQNPERWGWEKILPSRAAWVIALAKFIADPVWWFYLFWGAKFLYAEFGVNLRNIGLPFFSIYLASWAIGIFLGWLSSKFMKLGMGINRGRKFGLLACSLFALPVFLVPHVNSLGMAVFLIALAAGGHCGWSANVFALMSDLFPRQATASVAGFGGFVGAIGGALVAFLVGRILQVSGTEGYAIPFAVASVGYVVALVLMHLILPVFKPVETS
jgi:ACS family hexuronate transporter-like MFS transporter